MQKKTYIRLLILALLVCTSLVFISYSTTTKTASDNKEGVDDSKNDPKKMQSEFIFWESLSRNLFGICN